MEEIMAEKYLNLTTDINLQVQKPEQSPRRINSKKLTQRNTIIKLLKTKTKKKTLKIVTKKQYPIYMDKIIQIIAELL